MATAVMEKLIFSQEFSWSMIIPSRISVNPESPNQTSNMNSFYLSPVNEKEVFYMIQSPKSGKSPGYDGIRAEQLKEIAEEITQLLTSLINNIFRKSQCPSAFKKSAKKGVLEIADNYRPIPKILKSRIQTRAVNKRCDRRNTQTIPRFRSTEY